ncbi:MAG: AraC family transcriptional regulator [Bacteroidales bacterium]|nr:AraC family transcriptional regulator [Bacteroidales bacterium]
MKAKIDALTIPILRKMFKLSEANYVGEDFVLAMDNHALGREWFTINQPYLLAEGAVIRIVDGLAVYTVNLDRYELHQGDILVFPENAVFTINWVTDDLRVQFMTFHDLQLSHPIRETKRYSLSYDNWNRSNDYFTLLWNIVNQESFSRESVTRIQEAFLADLDHIGALTPEGWVPTRQDEVFDRFIQLLNDSDGAERSIPWFAERLFVTPNRLSNIVKEVSGQTVMQWINRKVVQNAKMLLKHSDLRINEVADKLGFPNPSFFSKFFHRETGMTPNAFRQS